MRVLPILAFFSVLAASMPAMAGSVSYVDMRGKWQSTQCAEPQAPAPLSSNAEEAADTLNAQKAARFQYVTAVQAYMECLSKEAARDAEATGVLVTKSAQELIDKAAAGIKESADTTPNNAN